MRDGPIDKEEEAEAVRSASVRARRFVWAAAHIDIVEYSVQLPEEDNVGIGVERERAFPAGGVEYNLLVHRLGEQAAFGPHPFHPSVKCVRVGSCIFHIFFTFYFIFLFIHQALTTPEKEKGGGGAGGSNYRRVSPGNAASRGGKQMSESLGTRDNAVRLRHVEPTRVPYDTLRRALHRFLTRCIGWRKNNHADHPISYQDTVIKTGNESI